MQKHYSSVKNRGFSKEREQKLKTWMGNQTGKRNKKSEASENAEIEEKRENIMERKEQHNTIRTDDTIWKDEPKGISKKKKRLKNTDQTVEKKQNITKQQKKIQPASRKRAKTYKQTDAREANNS